MTDPFAAPSGGKFPKLDDLDGELLLIVPEKVETVPNRFAKGPQDRQTTERATADVTVLHDDGTTETFERMFLSQQVLLSACESALKPGNKPMILSRLEKVATKESRENLKIGDTAADYTAAREKWLKGGGKGPEPKHVWILSGFSEDDAAKARTFLATKDPFATAAG